MEITGELPEDMKSDELVSLLKHTLSTAIGSPIIFLSLSKTDPLLGNYASLTLNVDSRFIEVGFWHDPESMRSINKIEILSVNKEP
jgi:hypothetical protein